MLYELDPVKSLSVFAAMCGRPAKTVVCYQSWLLWMICIHLGLLDARSLPWRLFHDWVRLFSLMDVLRDGPT